jgi:hypothetical protein
MDNTMVIFSVTDAIKIGSCFQHNWFRGHPREFKELTPKVFREPFYYESCPNIVEDTEFAIIEMFQRLAPAISRDLPPTDDTLDWLILMQHHGCPTRLLDWTQSILVALFFAVNDSTCMNKDGELWTIYPQKLNELNGIYGYPIKNAPILKYLSSKPIHNSPEQIASEFNINPLPSHPVAFFPTLQFPRITSQLGAFTIHNSPSDSQKLIETISDKSDLACYLIPCSSKEGILTDLNILGINYRTMFHDLDSLSKDIIEQFKNRFWNAWGQPDFDNFIKEFESKQYSQ